MFDERMIYNYPGLDLQFEHASGKALHSANLFHIKVTVRHYE